MSFLKTNIRIGADSLQADAIGGGIRNYIEGSAGGAPGIAGGRMGRFYGGLVMFTITDSTSALSITGESILAQHYGVTMVSNYLNGGTGFKVYPIAAYQISNASVAFMYQPVYSQAGSTVIVLNREIANDAGVNGSAIMFGSGEVGYPCKIRVFGLIVSTPFVNWGS